MQTSHFKCFGIFDKLRFIYYYKKLLRYKNHPLIHIDQQVYACVTYTFIKNNDIKKFLPEKN